MLAPIVTTKLQVPPVRSTLVNRPRLFAQLTQGLQRKLTLVAAPAGSGKTTLLSAWIEQLNGQAAVGWFSLDDNDNDLSRFLTYLIMALQSAESDLGHSALALLDAPGRLAPDAVLTALINEMSDSPQSLVMILDDYHLIEAPAIHDAMTFLLEHLPPTLRLIIASRTDPPLPLSRLRIRNQLQELRSVDLSFLGAEAEAFLNQVMALGLSEEDITALEMRTEGWVAGLQVVGLAVRSQLAIDGQKRLPANLINEFSGGHRHMRDFLSDEVLHQQLPEVQEFLLRTAILDRLSGSLCQAVTGKTDSHKILEHLEAANLFLIPLDHERHWYRYHHLFRDFLREQLPLSPHGAQRQSLHQRASDWFLQHGYDTEAIEHALEAGDYERAFALAESRLTTMLTRGEVVTVQNWLKKFPPDVLDRHPRLILAEAWAAAINNNYDNMDALIARAEQSLQRLESAQPAAERPSPRQIRAIRGEIAAIRSLWTGDYENDVEATIALAAEALTLLPEDEQQLRSVVTMVLGTAHRISGNFAEAVQILSDTVVTSRATGNFVTALLALHILADFHAQQGQLTRALRYCQEAIQLTDAWSEETEKPIRALPFTGQGYIICAEILRERNELAAAQHYIQASMRLVANNVRTADQRIANLVQARIWHSENRLAEALTVIERAVVSPAQDPEIDLWIEAVRTRLWLAQSDLDKAAHWAQGWPLPLDDPRKFLQYPGEYTTLARVFIAQDKLAEAAALLDRLGKAMETRQRQSYLIEILILQSVTLAKQQQLEAALAALALAVRMAEAEGYVRLFVDEGAAVAELLAQLRSRPGGSAYVNTLLAAFGPPQAVEPNHPPSAADPLLDPLSKREIEVLRLVAAGQSNQEIATDLVIAVSTVKSHTNKIFSKLDVQNRTQAVAKARELRLL